MAAEFSVSLCALIACNFISYEWNRFDEQCQTVQQNQKKNPESNEIHGTSKTKFNLSAQEIKISTTKYKTKNVSWTECLFSNAMHFKIMLVAFELKMIEKLKFPCDYVIKAIWCHYTKCFVRPWFNHPNIYIPAAVAIFFLLVSISTSVSVCKFLLDRIVNRHGV